VTGDVLDFALETLAIERAGLRERLMQLYLTLDAFTEVPRMLDQDCGPPSCRTARPQFCRLPWMAPSSAASSIPFSRSRRSASTNPTPKVYQLAVDRRSLPASEIAFQSSNSWDTHAAAAFGMQVVWCNRYAQRRERLPGTPAAR
jgi:2-haloacid dehalogenase